MIVLGQCDANHTTGSLNNNVLGYCHCVQAAIYADKFHPRSVINIHEKNNDWRIVKWFKSFRKDQHIHFFISLITHMLLERMSAVQAGLYTGSGYNEDDIIMNNALAKMLAQMKDDKNGFPNPDDILGFFVWLNAGQRWTNEELRATINASLCLNHKQKFFLMIMFSQLYIHGFWRELSLIDKIKYGPTIFRHYRRKVLKKGL